LVFRVALDWRQIRCLKASKNSKFEEVRAMKSISNWLASLGMSVAAWAASSVFTLAHAVSDLPGGPGVNQLNLPAGATKIAEEQAWLHWFMLVVCTVIFVAVFAVMFYSIWKHRKSVGHKPANFHESVAVEIAWTIVPFVIVVFMGLMATKTVVTPPMPT
jgi:cytochrome c oxidase subunit 2